MQVVKDIDSRLNEYFGFTDKEVDKLLNDANAIEYAIDIKNWYDGYHLGSFDVYCPWDVMNYLRDIQNDSTQKPKSYWKNTSDNAIIRSFIDYAGNSITKKIEILLAGGYITQPIDTQLTYDYLHSSEDNLWSILYLTGYLTIVRGCSLSNGEVALKIPNAEIKEIFEVKYSKELKDLSISCEMAIKQIDEKMYAKEFEDEYDEVLCYGIAFYKKRCVVRGKVKLWEDL